MAEGVKVADLFGALGIRPDVSSFKAADRMLGAVKGALVAIASLATARWAVGMVKETTNAADKLDELSQQTGVNVESLQALGHAASFSGLGVTDLAGALGFLGKNADAASRGSKVQSAAFRKVGLDAKAVASGAITTEAALGQIAERFAAMPDGAAKSTLSMQLFGRSGKALIPFLNEGKAGIARLTAEARELGVVMDGKTVKEMAAFNDENDKLNAQIKGLKIQIVSALLPTLMKLITGVRGWVKANRELIASTLATMLKGLIVAGQAFGAVLEVVAKALTFLVENLELTAFALGAVGVAMLILRAKSVAAAIASGLAWAASLLPLILLAAAIGAVFLLFQDLYNWLTGKDSVLKDIWAWFLSELPGLIAEVIDGMVERFTQFFDWLARKIKETFGDELLLFEGKMQGKLAARAGLEKPTGAVAASTPGLFTADNAKEAFTPWVDRSSSIAGTIERELAYRSQLNANVVINGAGGSPEQIAAQVDGKLREFKDDLARETASAFPGGE